MNHDEARELASEFWHIVEDSETHTLAVDALTERILTACNCEAELAAAAMVEKCAKSIEDIPTLEYENRFDTLAFIEAKRQLANRLRSLSPSRVLEEHDLEVAWREFCQTPPEPLPQYRAEFWQIYHHWRKKRYDHHQETLAALRQPTAEKDHHAD